MHGKDDRRAARRRRLPFTSRSRWRPARDMPPRPPTRPPKPGNWSCFTRARICTCHVITVGADSPQQTPGDIFVAPYTGVGQDGPMIFESSGNLVWFDPLPPGTEATNLQVQQYEGKPVLTLVAGVHPAAGLWPGRRGDRELLLPADREIPRRQRPARRSARIPDHAQRHGAAHRLQPDPLRPGERRRPPRRGGHRQRLSGNRPEDAPRQAGMDAA